MRNPSSARFAIPLLCVCAMATGCRVPQPPQVSMAGLQVDVLRVKNGKRGIEIGVKIFNDHDLKVSFDLCDVRMKCDKELSPANPKGQSVRLDIQPKTYREFRWTFPLEAPLPPGSYTIEIKSLYELDVLLPNKVEFQFNV